MKDHKYVKKQSKKLTKAQRRVLKTKVKFEHNPLAAGLPMYVHDLEIGYRLRVRGYLRRERRIINDGRLFVGDFPTAKAYAALK